MHGLWLQLVSLKFAVLGGSSAEAEDEKGAAHLLSVAAFAGTMEKSGLRLMRELEDIGATVSASADREKITLDVTVMSSMAELAFARLAETVSSPPKNKFALYDCMGAAQVAYDSHMASPKKLLVDLLHEAAYGETSPMGSPFLAEHGNLTNLAPESVFKYREHQYTANNLVVASSGLTHDTLKQYTVKYLSQLSSSADGTAAVSPYVGGDARLRMDCGGSTYTALAFPVPGAGIQAKPYNVLRVLLHNRIQKKLAAASTTAVKHLNEITSFYAPYTGTGGLWGVYTSSQGPLASNDMLAAAIDALKSIDANITTVELNCAKNQVIAMTTSEYSVCVRCICNPIHPYRTVCCGVLWCAVHVTCTPNYPPISTMPGPRPSHPVPNPVHEYELCTLL